MTKFLIPCISCDRYITGTKMPTARCSECYNKFFARIGAGTSAKDIAKELYDLYMQEHAIEAKLQKIRELYMKRMEKEINKVIADAEKKLGQPIAELRNRKKSVENQMREYMRASNIAHITVQNLLIELKEQMVSRGNMPQYKKIVDELRDLLNWSKEEMDLFVKSRYSLPRYEDVLTITQLPKTPSKKSSKKADKDITINQVSAEEFYNAINKATRGKLRKYKGFLSPFTLDDYKTMECYLTSTKDAGYCITPEKELVSVFNASPTKGVGASLVRHAIEHGAKFLTAFHGFLPNLYRKFHFTEKERYKFDPKLAPKHWHEEEFGQPDVIFMEHTKPQKTGCVRYRLSTMTLPRLALVYEHLNTIRPYSCIIQTPSKVYAFRTNDVLRHGLMNALRMQNHGKSNINIIKERWGSKQITATLKVPDDIRCVQAFCGERYPNYVIAQMKYDEENHTAQLTLKRANVDLSKVHDYLSHIQFLLVDLYWVAKKKYENALKAISVSMAATQADLPDNVEDLSLKWERHNVGGESFGPGTSIMQRGVSPSEPESPIRATDVL